MRHEEASRALERHFVRGLAPAKEHALRTHMADCAPCRTRYERYAAMASLDRKMLTTEERLARGLGLRKPRTGGPIRLWGAMGLAAACGAVVLHLASGRGFAPAEPAFAARGTGQEAKFHLSIFRTGAGAGESARDSNARDRTTAAWPPLLARTMKKDEELAFAYVNPTPRPFLAIFGTDEHRHVYWYHPAWHEGEAAPKSIPTLSGTELHELKESIRHELDGHHLVITAVLSERPMDVRSIEGAVAREVPLTTIDPSARVVDRREVDIAP